MFFNACRKCLIHSTRGIYVSFSNQSLQDMNEMWFKLFLKFSCAFASTLILSICEQLSFTFSKMGKTPLFCRLVVDSLYLLMYQLAYSGHFYCICCLSLARIILFSVYVEGVEEVVELVNIIIAMYELKVPPLALHPGTKIQSTIEAVALNLGSQTSAQNIHCPKCYFGDVSRYRIFRLYLTEITS